MSRQDLDELKQQIPLLDYLQAHDWRPARTLSRGRFMGLCPLHEDHEPSFLVDPLKNLFYCYGCGRGGDVIRFAELYHQVKFAHALALLRQWLGLPPLLRETTEFYRMQLHRHSEAVAYLYQRGVRSSEVILVEGLFDYAALWQAGFHNVTCSLGTNLNARQFRQLRDSPRTVYLAFDADTNGSGQQAAQSLACRLTEQGVNVRTVALPEGHDPNSFFAQGGDAHQFQCLMEAARG